MKQWAATIGGCPGNGTLLRGASVVPSAGTASWPLGLQSYILNGFWHLKYICDLKLDIYGEADGLVFSGLPLWSKGCGFKSKDLLVAPLSYKHVHCLHYVLNGFSLVKSLLELRCLPQQIHCEATALRVAAKEQKREERK